jgi:PAS domain S-box-containing protein
MPQQQIDLYVANPVDRRLLCEFLRELGYIALASDLTEETPSVHAGVSLVIADTGGARRYGRRLLELKWRTGPSFLPFLIMLPASASSIPWLQMGYDDIIRQPMAKGELKARLEVFLRFRSQSEQYRSIFEDALIGLCRIAPDGRILIGNSAFCRMLGHESFSALCDDGDALAPRVSPTNAELVRRFESEDRIVGLESTWRRRDGSELFALENVHKVRDDEGTVLYYESSIEDTTERRRRDEQLRRSREERERLHVRETAARVAAEKHLSEKILLADVYRDLASSLEPSDVSAAICRAVHQITGSDGATFVLRDGAEVIYSDECSIEPLWKGQRFPIDDCVSGWVMVHRKPAIVDDIFSDERVPIEAYRPTFVRSMAIVPVREHDPIGAIGTYWSQPHKAGEHEIRMMRALADAADVAFANARLFEQMKEARLEAEAASRLKDEFLATVSHELRTPLTAIIGWSAILRGDVAGNAAASEGLEIIERQGRAQAKIIDDLLDVSRIITGKLHLDIDRVDVDAIVSAAVDSISPSADHKRVAVTVARGSIAARLQQVVWNLLSNAVKFTPPGGRIAVRSDVTERDVVITVTDSGEGISPDFLPYVFDRFRQADGRTTRAHGGLGLGLAIVRNLVELHNGTVRVESPGLGRGATFSVRLPRGDAHPITSGPNGYGNGAAVSYQSEQRIQLTGLELLVVDDDPDTRGLLASLLARRGAAVRTARSVDEALELLGAFTPDVLVSDIGMPGRDGFDLIRAVRARSSAPLPAVAVTAYARHSDQERALAEGFQAFVAKPVEPEDLVAVVARLAGRDGDGAS